MAEPPLNVAHVVQHLRSSISPGARSSHAPLLNCLSHTSATRHPRLPTPPSSRPGLLHTACAPTSTHSSGFCCLWVAGFVFSVFRFKNSKRLTLTIVLVRVRQAQLTTLYLGFTGKTGKHTGPRTRTPFRRSAPVAFCPGAFSIYGARQPKRLQRPHTPSVFRTQAPRDTRVCPHDHHTTSIAL